MVEYSQKSLNELLIKAEQLEKELRTVYREIYNHPLHVKKGNVFNNLDESSKNSITASTGAYWDSVRKSNKEIKSIDCFTVAQQWFQNKNAHKYADLDISLHDLVMRFQQLKNKDLRKL